MYEGLDDPSPDQKCNDSQWVATCLDISNSTIQDYATFNKIVAFLQRQTNDIVSRCNITLDVAPVAMVDMNPDYLLNPTSTTALQTVKVTGQVPHITFQMDYPAPLQGPRGESGSPGDVGLPGPTGPTGDRGPPAYQ